VADNSSGAPTIIAAAIIGLAILGGGFMVTQSIERSQESLGAAMVAAVEKMPAPAAAPAAAPSRAAARPGRPDPSKRYEVAVGSSPVKGPEDAKVTIVEFSDFQCPFCSRVTPTLKKIREEYPEDVKVVWKHLPLSIHPKAPGAHAAAEAAHKQGKFWEMHDLIFANQREMSDEKYLEYAAQLDLDLDQFKKDVASAEVKKQVSDDTRLASTLGVTGTPGFFINGRFLSGARPYDSFKVVIDEELEQN